MISESPIWLGGGFFLKRGLKVLALALVLGLFVAPFVCLALLVALFLGLSALWLPIILLAWALDGVGIVKMFDDQMEPTVAMWVLLSLVTLPFLIPLVYGTFALSETFLWSQAQRIWRFRTPRRLLARIRSEGERILAEREADRIRAVEASREIWEETLRQNQIEQDEKDRQIALRHSRESKIREHGGGSRYPRDADDFEEVAAAFARLAGFPDARRTPKGPDGGIDVIAKEMVGQAKFHPSQKVSPIDIRALAGSRQEVGAKYAMFFHYGPGYSTECLKVARKLGVLLYELVPPGRFQRIQ